MYYQQHGLFSDVRVGDANGKLSDDHSHRVRLAFGGCSSLYGAHMEVCYSSFLECKER
jgi:hypothetical protein